jgi:ferredoxin
MAVAATPRRSHKLGKHPEFYVDADLCTECGDCITALPAYFRKVEGEEIAEVHKADVSDADLPNLEKMMADCPASAILWKK